MFDASLYSRYTSGLYTCRCTNHLLISWVYTKFIRYGGQYSTEGFGLQIAVNVRREEGRRCGWFAITKVGGQTRWFGAF